MCSGCSTCASAGCSTRTTRSSPTGTRTRRRVADRYHEQDPAIVAGELASAAGGIAASFAAVEGDQWDRVGRRSDGAVFTVRSFARYFVHDPIHHLWDVGG